jgi:hypothetical protein
MHHLGVSIHNSFQSLRLLQFGNAVKALAKKSNILSLQAVLEELSWILRL